MEIFIWFVCHRQINTGTSTLQICKWWYHYVHLRRKAKWQAFTLSKYNHHAIPSIVIECLKVQFLREVLFFSCIRWLHVDSSCRNILHLRVWLMIRQSTKKEIWCNIGWKIDRLQFTLSLCQFQLWHRHFV